MIMRKKYYAEKLTEIVAQEPKKIKYKKATSEKWKPSRHSKMLFDMNFRKWGIEE